MKQLRVLLISVTVMLLVSGCTAGKQEAAETIDHCPDVYSQDEYIIYQNVFYGDYASQLLGKEVSKQGVLAEIYDAFSKRTRWYVWGYYDQTKCCDWQWEIVPKNKKDIPANGSLVTVKGTFSAGEDALDGYWITDASFITDALYVGETADLNMMVMSCTLQRVQMYNIIYIPDAFKEKTCTAYGRIAGPGVLEDPYYNGSWHMNILWTGETPAIGKAVNIQGVIKDGEIQVSNMELMQ